MADCPTQGSNEGTWGTDYFNFLKKVFHMSGNFGGELTVVCNQNQVVCNKNQVVTNVDRSLQ